MACRTHFARMIYGTVVRQRPDGVFGAFDCPDAGQIAPKRNRSTTPLQAFNLLNSSFMMQQSDFFAERLEKEAGPNRKRQEWIAPSHSPSNAQPDRQGTFRGAELIRDAWHQGVLPCTVQRERIYLRELKP